MEKLNKINKLKKGIRRGDIKDYLYVKPKRVVPSNDDSNLDLDIEIPPISAVMSIVADIDLKAANIMGRIGKTKVFKDAKLMRDVLKAFPELVPGYTDIRYEFTPLMMHMHCLNSLRSMKPTDIAYRNKHINYLMFYSCYGRLLAEINTIRISSESIVNGGRPKIVYDNKGMIPIIIGKITANPMKVDGMSAIRIAENRLKLIKKLNKLAGLLKEIYNEE